MSAQLVRNKRSGDHREVLLVAGIKPAKFDCECDESNERYQLLLQPVASSEQPRLG